MGLGFWIAAVNNILTEEHRRARLAFARRYIRYQLAFWKSVIFSDKKYWSTKAHGWIRVQRLRKTRFNAENILNVNKSCRCSACVWAGLSWERGLTLLTRVIGNSNSSPNLC